MKTILSRVVLAVLASSAAVALPAKEKPHKPKLEVRALPRMATAPVEVLIMADLRGGDDIEEFHCLELEVDWDDGGKSVKESDCPPFEPGTLIDRHYTADHEYRRGGAFNVAVRLKRADRIVAAGKIQLTINPALGQID